MVKDTVRDCLNGLCCCCGEETGKLMILQDTDGVQQTPNRFREVLKAILLGQVISLLNCATAIISESLSRTYNINAPTAQSFLNYVLLCSVYTSWLACCSGDDNLIVVLRSRGWRYLFLAIVDVEANYLVVKAYQHTTLTSVQLLDCFTIPTVLVLSWIFLKARYGIINIAGVFICLIGVVFVVWADIKGGRGNLGGDDRFLGDILCLFGACLYGISNVSEEFLVKNFNRVEALGMLGLFGTVVNGIQLLIFERGQLTAINWGTWQIGGLFISFALVLFTFYSVVPCLMKVSNSTALNLSILTCDFYTFLAAVFLFNYRFHFFYLLSFTLVIAGVIIYSLRPVRRAD